MLSIVMPVFNHPEELRVMLDSLLVNDYQEWELLAVDDGSEAETLDLLQQYAEADPRLRILRRDRQPKGAQTCRNMGLDAAQGEYICFFDSDDYVTPDCLRQRVSEIARHPELDFMVFRSGTYNETGFQTDTCRNTYGYPIYEDDIEAFCQRTLPFVVWNNIYRRASLLQNGIRWDEHLSSLQDAQFNMECLTSDMKYAYSDSPANYGYRIGSLNSVSKLIMSQAHLESNLYAIRRFYELVQKCYGHRYDKALYRGMLYVYTKVARAGVSREFEECIHRLLQQYAPGWGRFYAFHTALRRLLAPVLSDNLARRISTIGYLNWFRTMERKTIPSLLRKQVAPSDSASIN